MVGFINVQLVTPALIGGSHPRQCDKLLQLRPTEIRAMLRFWTRALAAGAGLDYREEEKMLFGSTEGASPIRVLTSLLTTNMVEKQPLFPHKKEEKAKAMVEMILPSPQNIVLRFGFLKNVNLEKFKSVLWTWLHLGTIGRRGRRGYGSLLWLPEKDDLLSEFKIFNHENDLDTVNSLTEYLKQEFDKVAKIWSVPTKTLSLCIKPFFQLYSLDQIFVGNILKENGKVINTISHSDKGLQAVIHGLNSNQRINPHTYGGVTGSKTESNEMGFAFKDQFGKSHRLGSPMIWRIFPCGGGLVPVMTWSPRNTTKLTTDTEMYYYLTNTLGFKTSLAGKVL